MNAPINRTDNKALPGVPEVLHAFAGELPLEILLMEMRRFYRGEDDPCTGGLVDYQQLCDTWIRSLDAELARLGAQHAQ